MWSISNLVLQWINLKIHIAIACLQTNWLWHYYVKMPGTSLIWIFTKNSQRTLVGMHINWVPSKHCSKIICWVNSFSSKYMQAFSFMQTLLIYDCWFNLRPVRYFEVSIIFLMLGLHAAIATAARVVGFLCQKISMVVLKSGTVWYVIGFDFR